MRALLCASVSLGPSAFLSPVFLLCFFSAFSTLAASALVVGSSGISQAARVTVRPSAVSAKPILRNDMVLLSFVLGLL